MDCEVVEEISIVWNNPGDVGQDILSLTPKWKRPVYFHKTQFDSMSFRFQLPQPSSSALYFVIDDDIDMSCAQLQHGFAIWQSKAAQSQYSPLVGYVRRSINYNIAAGTFQYYPHTDTPYYTFILVGAAFISRDYLLLFNSHNQQAQGMFKHAQLIKNCDDLMMNFLVTKYYHYFTPTFIIPLTDPLTNKPQFHLGDGPNGVSQTPAHYVVRHQCLRKYSQMSGSIPLKIYHTNESIIRKNHWQFPIANAIIKLSSNAIASLYFDEPKQSSAIYQSIKAYLPPLSPTPRNDQSASLTQISVNVALIPKYLLAMLMLSANVIIGAYMACRCLSSKSTQPVPIK